MEFKGFDEALRPLLVSIYTEEKVAELETSLEELAQKNVEAGIQQKSVGQKEGEGDAPPTETPTEETPTEETPPEGPTLADVMGKLEELAGIVKGHADEIKAVKESMDKAAQEKAIAGNRRTYWPAEAPPVVVGEGSKAVSADGVPMESPMRPKK